MNCTEDKSVLHEDKSVLHEEKLNMDEEKMSVWGIFCIFVVCNRNGMTNKSTYTRKRMHNIIYIANGIADRVHNIIYKVRAMMIMLALLLTVVGAEARIIRVGVFLPFNNESKQKEVVEYYRGLLMAVDSLNKTSTAALTGNAESEGESHTFHITAADCGTTATDMLSLLDESKNGVFQIIFAPSNQNQLKILDNYSRQNGTKICVPFGGRYDEWVANPAFYALRVTETDMAVPAYTLIQQTLPERDIYIIDAGSKQYSPLANYVKKYTKGAKVLEYPKKEKKIIKLLSDDKAILLPAMYDENTEQIMAKLCGEAGNVKAAVIGYPAWYERANAGGSNSSAGSNIATDAKALRQMNAYVIQTSYPRTDLPRVRKFAADYQSNFDTPLKQEPFSLALWGFDTGYYLLKALARYGQNYSNQPLYAAPLQTPLRFAPRANGQGYINTAAQLLHYRPDGLIDIIQPKE